MTKILQQIRSKIIYYALYLIGRTPEQLWKKKLTKLLVGVPENKLKIYETVLNNQHLLQYESRELDFERITKLVLDSLTIIDLIGVQPMSRPVELLYYIVGIKTKEVSTVNGKNIMFEVVSQVIEAHTRKLVSLWRTETVQEAITLHSLDRSNLESIFAIEVATEITAELIKDLVALSEKQEIIVKNSTAWTVDAIVHLNVKCIDISKETFRGCGNRLIMSPVLFAKLDLKNSPSFVSKELNAGEMQLVSLLYVGTLFTTIKVYLSVHLDNIALIGYKGANEIDAGYFFAPYIMMKMKISNLDQETLTFMTRYGKHHVENVSAYYKSVTFKFENTV